MGALPPSDPILNNIITQNLHYWQIAATTVALYDHVSTLDLEIELIWKKKFSTVQILYLLNRYSGDALFIHGVWYQLWLRGEAFEKACLSATLVQSWISMVGLWSMQAIIIHRIWCMYRRSKPVLILLVCTFLGQVTTSSTIIALDKSKNAAFPFVRDMLVCVPGGAKPFLEWYWAYLVFIIAFDVVAFTLALMEGIRYFRRTQLTEGSLVRILLRDSIFFPFLGLSVSIFALLAWRAVLPYPSVAVLMTLMALTSPILGSRLILNLRDAYYKPFAEEVNPGAVPSHRQLSSGPTIRTPIEIQRSVEVSRSHINDVQLQIFPIQKV